jgi:hypothetical protein
MIYRNIKSENFLLKISKKGNYIYIIDLNFMTEYRFYRAYISAFPFNFYLFGTARFANINKYFEIDKFTPSFDTLYK